MPSDQAPLSMEHATKRREFHLAAWLAPTLIAAVSFLLTILANWAGWEMYAMMGAIAAIWVLAVILLWLLPGMLKLKWAVRVVLTLAAIVVMVLTYKFDRPILPPVIERVVASLDDPDHPIIDLLVAVQNSGRQGSFADKREAVLVVGGTKIEGQEVFGRPLPSHSENAPNLSEQEFTPTKPVRGWAFFLFDGISRDFVESNLVCGSAALQKVEIIFTIRDAKMHREWSSQKSLAELGKDGCVAQAAENQPTQPSDSERHQQKIAPLGQASHQEPPMSQKCAPGASCAQSTGQSGGVTAGTYIGHVEPEPRVMSPEQIKALKDAVSGHPSKVLVLYQNGDTEAYNLGEQIQGVLKSEGWTPQQDVTGGQFTSEGAPLKGIRVSWQGKSVPPGTVITFDTTTPWGALCQQLQRDFPEEFYPQPGERGAGHEDQIMIQVFANPKPAPTQPKKQ